MDTEEVHIQLLSDRENQKIIQSNKKSIRGQMPLLSRESSDSAKGLMVLLTTADSDNISIFPDYTLEVSRKQAKFNDLKGMLHECKMEGLCFGVAYPSEVRITFAVGTEKFKDPSKARTG